MVTLLLTLLCCWVGLLILRELPVIIGLVLCLIPVAFAAWIVLWLIH